MGLGLLVGRHYKYEDVVGAFGEGYEGLEGAVDDERVKYVDVFGGEGRVRIDFVG